MHLISGGDTGGAKTHVITLLRELKNHMDIELVCLAEGVFAREAEQAGIRTTVVRQNSRFDFSVLRQIRERMDRQRTQVLHCHGARANFIGSLLKSSLDIPLVTTIHSDFEHDFDNHLLKKLVFTTLNKASLRKMDHYLAVTENFKDMLVSKGFPERKIHVIYNGIALAGSTAGSGREEFLEGVGLRDVSGQYLVGCATRLHPVKGVDVLLKAAKRVVRSEKGIHFIIAGFGDPKYTRFVQDYIRDNRLGERVHLIGFIQDIHGFYNSIDLNVLPSYSESFPYALLEGGLHGLPTVASKAGGVVEMIEDGKSGILFEVGDDKGLAKAVLAMAKDRRKAAALGASFRERIRENFSDVSMGERHRSIYEDIIRRSKG
ncbi:glycosyltransferase family 4 protein [Anaerotalea alkaliphila]|uniref:Glycosyltransferase family 4 protein n=1 Tax=Anaerotalea alkaliphila TaxID=2662126 RepID=A0A7X5HTR4_9FIRM|nr:glycosyltransferase family 4 protein [Anaerotalea alkaliphila]NDL66493.1 glycosyltransferase family 4 protein [Anaerotalea alkaliphila]